MEELKEFEKFLVENFKEELDNAMILVGIPVGDTKNEAEENLLKGYVPIEKITPFVKAGEKLQKHFLNVLLERRGGDEVDKKIEAELPEMFQPTRQKLVQEAELKRKEEWKANLKEFEDLDDGRKQAITERLKRNYEIGDMEKFYKDINIISAHYKIKFSKEQAIELINKKVLEEFGETPSKIED